MTTHKTSLLDQALKAGTIAALLFAAAKSVYYYLQSGENPFKYFQNISGMVFGNQAFTSGTFYGWVVSGFVFHFLATLLISVIYFFAYQNVNKILHNKFLIGIIYGLTAWLLINFLIAPIITKTSIVLNLGKTTIAALIFIAAIGLPVALLANRFYSKKN